MTRPRLTRSAATGLAACTGAMIALTGCVPNAAQSDSASARAIAVTLNDSRCSVDTARTAAGTITFQITNTGNEVNEFEILASDKLRIAGEKENVTPGTTVNYVVQLAQGSYFTACKKGMVGSPTSVTAFTVTAGSETRSITSDSNAVKQAVTNYTAYVRDQTGQLLVATESFARAYEAKDDETARAQYAMARMHYERIEPTAEQFGTIDPALDLREKDLETGDTWTGWHRIEKDLWPPAGYTSSDAATRATLGAQLVSDTRKLNTLVNAEDFHLTLDQISNGASGLMEEVATSKITGEEEAFSHTDLWDFTANVEGAEVAYGTVKDILAAKNSTGKALATTLDTRFATIDALLKKYTSGTGYELYTDLTSAQVKELSDAVNALSEPLSRLTEVLVK